MLYDVVIIGSGAAGLTSAIYAARANMKLLLIEGMQPGGQLTITSDIENFPGYADPVSGPELMSTIRRQAERVGAEIITGEVTDVDYSTRPFKVEVADKQIEAKTLIVATGASARWLDIPSEKAFYGKGVSACATCDGFFYKGKEVLVVGGGDTALEEASYLTNFASKVTLVHRRDELRGSKAMQKRAFDNPKIEFAWNSVIDEILGADTGVTGARLKDTKTGETRELSCDGVFIAIGHTPNTKLFEGKLELDDQGYIVTPKTSMQTSVAGIFAAGDCQDSKYRQAVTAAGTGCMAAIDAEHFLQEN